MLILNMIFTLYSYVPRLLYSTCHHVFSILWPWFLCLMMNLIRPFRSPESKMELLCHTSHMIVSCLFENGKKRYTHVYTCVILREEKEDKPMGMFGGFQTTIFRKLVRSSKGFPPCYAARGFRSM